MEEYVQKYTINIIKIHQILSILEIMMTNIRYQIIFA